VFTQDKQQQEVRLLWDTVKNYSDTKSRKLSIYPVFDSDWFDAIFNQWLATQTSPQGAAMDDARATADAKVKRKGEGTEAQAQAQAQAQAGKTTGYALLPPPSGSDSGLARAEITATVIGRQQETSDIMRLLQPMASHPRLVTLTGMGGVGKTTLALQIAQQFLQSNSFEDGVVWLPLGAVRYPEQLVEALALSLNLTTVLQDDNEQKSLFKAVCSYLSDKRMLLVLDNFEQILEARTLISELFKSTSTSPSSAGGGIKVLITSRCVLDLPIEQQYPLLPLATPRLNFDAFDPHHNHNQSQSKLLEVDDKSLDSIAQSPAVELFVKKVKQVKLDFELTRENALQIARICERLDGLPLAIEIAASRIKLFSLSALLQRLAEPLSFLGSKAVNAEAHQRTLYSTLNWSYNLLDNSQQQLFKSFGLLVAGGSLHMLEWLANRLDLDQDGLELVSALVNHSLLTKDEYYYAHLLQSSKSTILEKNSNLLSRLLESHFRMLEIVREFALDQLYSDQQQCEQILSLVLEYYLEILPQAEEGLSGSEQLHWLGWFNLEYPNIQFLLASLAAIGSHLSQTPIYNQVLKLLSLMRYFWLRKGNFRDGCKYLELFLFNISDQSQSDLSLARINLPLPLPSAPNMLPESAFDAGAGADADASESKPVNLDYIKALETLVILLVKRNDYDKALEYLSHCEDFYTNHAEKAHLMKLLNTKGIIYKKLGLFAEAKELYEEILTYFTEANNVEKIEAVLINLANVENRLENYADAVRYFERAVITAKQRNDLDTIIMVLCNLALVLIEQGDYDLAKRYLVEVLDFQYQTQEKAHYSPIAHLLGRVAFYQSDYAKALDYYEESLAITRELDDKEDTCDNLNDLTQLCIAQGNLTQAQKFVEESLSLAKEINSENKLSDALYYWSVIAIKNLDAHAQMNSPLGAASGRDRDRDRGWLYANDKKRAVKASLGQALQLRLKMPNRKDLAFILSIMAKLALLEKDWIKAIALLGFAAKILDGLARKNDNADWKREYETDIFTLKAHVPQEEFDKVWQEGSNASLDYVLSIIESLGVGFPTDRFTLP
jgi:predicted ATPase/tetratricopeptide (TPR) repeat protein